jgi:predicted ester cyclase
MSLENNKLIIRSYYESTGQKEIIDLVRKSDNPEDIEQMLKSAMTELFSPECIIHYPEGDKTIDEDIKNLTMQLVAFPDMKATVYDIIAEEDKVVTRFTMHATNEKPYMGIPATRKRIKLDGISIYRLVADKVVEGWWIGDMLGVMQQLGVSSES